MIICAAIKLKGLTNTTKLVSTVICGLRHGDCLKTISQFDLDVVEEEQGFIDHTGTFLNRKEALAHALACGQLSATTRWYHEDHNQDELYSEDLY